MDIDGKQCTICWYVDDMKISHVDPQVVSDVIGKIEGEFGKMTVTRGKKHRFVGMDIEFKEDKTVWITMIDYITECFEAFGEPIVKGANTPAKHNLFEVGDDIKLSEEKMDVLHSIVAFCLCQSEQGWI